MNLCTCSDHIKHTGPDVESGLIVLGGAMLEEPIREGVPPKMKGSVLMCVADTEEEVLERVRRDVYYEAGVWDKEKVSSSVLLLFGSRDWKSVVRMFSRLLGLVGRYRDTGGIVLEELELLGIGWNWKLGCGAHSFLCSAG
jgi:hypothetical protein